LNHTVVSGNTATDGSFGGGIVNAIFFAGQPTPTLVINNSQVTGNSADGGGIVNISFDPSVSAGTVTTPPPSTIKRSATSFDVVPCRFVHGVASASPGIGGSAGSLLDYVELELCCVGGRHRCCSFCAWRRTAPRNPSPGTDIASIPSVTCPSANIAPATPTFSTATATAAMRRMGRPRRGVLVRSPLMSW
jgi:hypothetical protein